METTVKFEIGAAHKNSVDYSGKFYIGVRNRTGRLMIYLKRDGGIADPCSNGEVMYNFYHDSVADAEAVIKEFINKVR